MNVFVLDEDIRLAVRYHVDKHVVKQVLETAQLLSTAVRQTVDNPPEKLYKSTHVNHPWAVWTRQSCSNFWWLVCFGKALCAEYTYRYDRTHKSEMIIDLAGESVEVFPRARRSPFPHCFPATYEGCSTVEGYRNYYNGAKSHLFSWTKREMPAWVGKENT